MLRKTLSLFALFALVVSTLAPATAGAAERPNHAGLEPVENRITQVSEHKLPSASINDGELVAVVIELIDESVASYEGGEPGLAATSPSVTGEEINEDSANVQRYLRHLDASFREFEDTLQPKVPRTRFIGQLDFVIGGVKALVPENSIEAIRGMPNVVGVHLDTLAQIQTDGSPGFIGADILWDQLGGQAVAGEGMIVGVLDTGIWPEHPSFSDPDPGGNDFPAPPTIPGSNGFGTAGERSTCDFGNVGHNENDAAFACNNKLIGAYNFTDTYRAVIGILPSEYDSARDSNGHGTHTASTAAGNGGVAASILGGDLGYVSGIAPRAHVIMYKVCQDQGCFSSDSAAAIEQAILDGVDVLNFSISGGTNPYDDIVSLAFLDAYNAGVLVAASAGNSGPGPDTVSHRSPWTMTVGASTTDRAFVGSITMTSDDGPETTFHGVSITGPIGVPTAVVYAGNFNDDGMCNTAFPAGTWTQSEIVICDRGVTARVAKSGNAAAGGAAGFVLRNLQGGAASLAVDNHFLPAAHLDADAGDALMSYLATYTNVMGTLSGGVKAEAQGDVMADFSSRGGPGQSLGISKPDVTAPGVQILAGHTPTPATIAGGAPGELFQAIQGTSMSAPHVAGAAALVRDANPDWSPGQIKSALMMSATRSVMKEDGTTPADAFDFGSGRIQPALAANVRMTISETGENFLAYRDNLWDANYPSLYIPQLYGAITVERTIQNETNRRGVWRTRVHSPDDLNISVPRRIRVPRNGERMFEIEVDGRNIPDGAVRHAWIEMRSRGQSLWFPVTVVKVTPTDEAVSLGMACEPTEIYRWRTTSCTITIQNNAFTDADVSVRNRLPRQLFPIPWTVEGGSSFRRTVSFDGVLSPATAPAPSVTIDPAAAPFGYFSLGAFGGAIEVSASDESITNFNVPSFEFAGEVYSQIGIVSNGYIVIGGGTGADVTFMNSDLPNPETPNNVLAPFWTDLNPGASGRVLINVLSDGTDTWTVIEWESVPNFGDGLTNTFQVWIGANTDVNPGEDISFTYGADISGGDGGALTVGVENKYGNEGGTIYFNGVGTPPAPTAGGYAVDVFSIAGEPGQTHTITYDAWGVRRGNWTNWAAMTSNLTPGISYESTSGKVTRPPRNWWWEEERGLIEREMSGRETPERETPERETPERETPERETPERETPERETPERGLIETPTG